MTKPREAKSIFRILQLAASPPMQTIPPLPPISPLQQQIPIELIPLYIAISQYRASKYYHIFGFLTRILNMLLMLNITLILVQLLISGLLTPIEKSLMTPDINPVIYTIKSIIFCCPIANRFNEFSINLEVIDSIFQMMIEIYIISILEIICERVLYIYYVKYKISSIILLIFLNVHNMFLLLILIYINSNYLALLYLK